MRTELLLEHFALLRTPQDVAHLEAAILDLAVRGKLVSQDSDDEPASVLIERIKAEKAQLMQAGTIRKEKPQPPIKVIDMLHKIPEGWSWVRLGDISKIGTGSTPLRRENKYYEGGTIPWTTSSATNELFITEASEFITDLALKENRLTIYPKHTLIVALYGQGKTRGQVSELLIETATNQACAAIVLQDSAKEIKKYIKLFFQKNYEDLRSLAEGGAQPNLNLRKIKETCIPLPPLPEQRRIVAKVDELLTQTRALAAQLQAADDALLPAAQAAFQALVEAPSRRSRRAGEQRPPGETGESAGRQAWERVASAFDTFSAGPRTIDALKQTVLGLAVQGKLVPQDPDDESASVLIERIKEEKARLVREKKIRKSKPLPPVKSDEMSCKLPRGWKWVRLDQLLAGIQAGRSPSASKRPAREKERGVLKVSAVSWGEFLPDENKALFLDTETDKMPSVQANDLLISRANTAELVGAVVLVRQDYPNLLLSDKTLRLDFVSGEIFKPYIVYALRASWVREVFESEATGTSSSMRNISQVKIRSVPVALPPLPEQRRIVAKVEALLGLCDALAAQAAAAEHARARLVQAMLNGG